MRWSPDEPVYGLLLGVTLVLICVILSAGLWHHRKLHRISEQVGRSRSEVHAALGAPARTLSSRSDLLAYGAQQNLGCMELTHAFAHRHTIIRSKFESRYRLQPQAAGDMPPCTGQFWDLYRLGPRDVALLCGDREGVVERADYCRPQ